MSSPQPTELSLVVIHLLKGALYRDSNEKLWSLLPSVRLQLDEYVSVLGLILIVDDAEGYAYLRSQPIDLDGAEFPRLIARHSLSFRVSVLLALLRRRLAEFDATSSEVRLVLGRDQIVEMLRLFLPIPPMRHVWWTPSTPRSKRSAIWASCAKFGVRPTSSRSDGS